MNWVFFLLVENGETFEESMLTPRISSTKEYILKEIEKKGIRQCVLEIRDFGEFMLYQNVFHCIFYM